MAAQDIKMNVQHPILHPILAALLLRATEQALGSQQKMRAQRC